MRYLSTTLLLLFFFRVFAQDTGQSANTWIELAPTGEYFRLSMPRTPKQEPQRARYGELQVNGAWYTAAADGASYAIWALHNENYQQNQDADAYLDACAELLWEALLQPARDKLPKDGRIRAAMTYVKDLPAKPLAGREYSVTIGELTGTTQFFVAQQHIFILMALNTPGGVWARARFFDSFIISPNLTIPAMVYGDPITPGIRSANNDANDYNRVLTGREVTQKVRVLEKPEPTYTNAARKYGVEGTVVLRSVFSKNGEVTNIYVVRKLPHGLTQSAIKAARSIRFSPALKDEQRVSMYMELQYNFNLY